MLVLARPERGRPGSGLTSAHCERMNHETACADKNFTSTAKHARVLLESVLDGWSLEVEERAVTVGGEVGDPVLGWVEAVGFVGAFVSPAIDGKFVGEGVGDRVGRIVEEQSPAKH